MGKGSKATVGYWYNVAYHAGLGIGPIDAFLEFRAADKTAWSGNLTASGTIYIDALNLFGGEKDQGGIQGNVDVMFGEAAQQPNSYLKQVFGNQVPAWRGLATLAFKGGKYGAMNPYPQKPSYKICRVLKGWDNDDCWYPAKAKIAVAASSLVPPDAPGWDYQVTPEEQNPGYANLAIPTSGWKTNGTAPFGSGPDLPAPPGTNWPSYTVLWIRRTVSFTGVSGQTMRITAENGCVVFINGSIVGASNRPNADIPYNDTDVVVVPLSAGQTYTIVVKAFDELQHATGDRTYLTIEISEPGLDAINPAHLLYYARTQQGMGREPAANMSDASFRTAADWYYAQGFGLCTEYDPAAESVDDFIERIEKVAGCSMSRSPVDGLWYLDVANGVYDLASLPVLTDDDILDYTETPTLLDSAVNSMSVEYFDPQQNQTVTTAPVQAMALVDAFGTIHDSATYPEIPTSGLALRVATRDLRAAVTPTRAFDLTTTRLTYGWRVGTYFRLQSVKRGIADMVCILAEKSSGTLKSGAITVTASQDIYSLPATSFVDAEPGVDTRPSQMAVAIAQQAVFEAPYIQLVQRLSRPDLAALPNDAGYLIAAAADPATSRDFTLAVSADGGATYSQTANGPFCPAAVIVEGDALTDAAPATAFTITGGTNLGQVVIGSAALWEDEIVRVDAIDATAGTLTLGRGCADTPPASHAANTLILFYDGAFAADSTEYSDGETIAAELLTNTGNAQLDPALAMPVSVTLEGRQVRPYPPAGILLNGLAYPSILNAPVSIAFATRNRVLQADQLVDSAAADVVPEDGTTYTLRGYIEGVIDATLSGETASPVVWTPSGPGAAHIELVAVRDALESRPFIHDFIVGNPLWTPANLTVLPAMWFNDISAASADGSGNCSQWNDLSASGWHLSQTAPALRPLIVGTGLNGRRTVRFSTANGVLTSSAARDVFRNVGAGWVIAVFRRNRVDVTPTARILVYGMGGATTNARGELLVGRGVAPYASYAAAAGIRLDSDALTVVNGPAALDTNFHMVLGTFGWSTKTLTMYQDGAQVAQSTAMGTGGATSNTISGAPFAVGGYNDGSSTSDAEIAEVIVGTGALPSTAEIDKIFGYLAYRWGLQSVLPIDHPYKTAPPTI